VGEYFEVFGALMGYPRGHGFGKPFLEPIFFTMPSEEVVHLVDAAGQCKLKTFCYFHLPNLG
jgi:hypothetical protein